MSGMTCETRARLGLACPNARAHVAPDDPRDVSLRAFADSMTEEKLVLLLNHATYQAEQNAQMAHGRAFAENKAKLWAEIAASLETLRR